MIPGHQLFVIEHASSRLAIAATDAGRARGIAAMMLFGNPHAPERDAMMVREPEEEERRLFESRQYAPTSEVALAAMML
jgi:hypothetical protein